MLNLHLQIYNVFFLAFCDLYHNICGIYRHKQHKILIQDRIAYMAGGINVRH